MGCGRVPTDDSATLWGMAAAVGDGSRPVVPDGFRSAHGDGACADDPRDSQRGGESFHSTEETVGELRRLLPGRECAKREGVDLDLGRLLQPPQTPFKLTAPPSFQVLNLILGNIGRRYSHRDASIRPLGTEQKEEEAQASPSFTHHSSPITQEIRHDKSRKPR